MPPEESDFRTKRVGIAGLGLMGGSLALDLRGRCAALVGYDLDAATRQQAVTLSLIHL